MIFGLTRATTAADLGRAALEGVAFQVADLIDAAAKDLGRPVAELRVDGGMARNDWFLTCQADVLGLPVLRAAQSESTALGAAFLAALGVRLVKGEAELKRVLSAATRFDPTLPAADRERKLTAWRKAVRAVIGFYTG